MTTQSPLTEVELNDAPEGNHTQHKGNKVFQVAFRLPKVPLPCFGKVILFFWLHLSQQLF